MDSSSVRNWADISVLNADVKTLLCRKIEELVVDVVSVLDILLETDDRESFKGFRLVDHGVEAIRIVQGSRNRRVCWGPRRGRLSLIVLVSTSGLLSEVGCLKDLRLLKHLGFDSVWIEGNIQAPLLDLLTLGDHLIKLLDGVDPIMGLLEKTLAHLGHGLLVLPHLLWDSDEHGELGRQVDVLSLLLDFEERLVHLQDLLIVLLLEVCCHRNGGTGFTLFEIARLWAHVETHIADLVGLVVTVARHDDSTFEFIEHGLLELLRLRRMARVSESLLSEPLHLLINQLEAVVNRQILTDIVDDEVEATLEDPRRREETRPCLHGVVENLGFRSHEKARIAPNLAKVGVTHLRLNDGVDEVESEGVLLHSHGVQVIEGEFANALN